MPQYYTVSRFKVTCRQNVCVLAIRPADILPLFVLIFKSIEFVCNGVVNAVHIYILLHVLNSSNCFNQMCRGLYFCIVTQNWCVKIVATFNTRNLVSKD